MLTLPEQLMHEATGLDCTGTVSVILILTMLIRLKPAYINFIDGNDDLVIKTLEDSATYYNMNQRTMFGTMLIVAIIVVCFLSLILLIRRLQTFVQKTRNWYATGDWSE